MKKTLLSAAILSSILISTTSQGLVIKNLNNRSVAVSVLDKDFKKNSHNQKTCTKDNYDKHDLKTKCFYLDDNNGKDSKYVCEEIFIEDYTCQNDIDNAIFKLQTTLESNGVIAIEESNAYYLPKIININIEGWTGSINKTVKNTCELTIHNNGFFSGIYAELGANC